MLASGTSAGGRAEAYDGALCGQLCTHRIGHRFGTLLLEPSTKVVLIIRKCKLVITSLKGELQLRQLH